MSDLVTTERYRLHTGDNATAATAVEEALVDAVAALEDVLERPLLEAERVERMYPNDAGRLFPKVTPIMAADGFQIDGATLFSVGPFPVIHDFIWGRLWIDITYTAGYVERTANPDATNRLPLHVEIDLCWAAYRLLRPATTAALASVPAGANSARVGDAAVGFGASGAGGMNGTGSGASLSSVWSRETLRLSHVRRRVAP